MAVNPKFVLFVGACFAIGATAIYFGRLHSASTAKSIHTSSAPQAIHVQPELQTVSDNKISTTPAAALAVTALTQTNSGTTTNVMGHFELMAWLRALAAKDLAAALDYVSKMPEGDERNDALEAVCFGLAQKDPARALDLVQSLQQPDSVSENIVQQWAESDLPSALAWVNNQPDGDARNEMLQRVVLVLAPSDPADTAGLIFEQMPAGQAQDEAIMTLLNQWANKDLKAAALWVENNLSNSPLRDRALAELEGMQNYQKALASQ